MYPAAARILRGLLLESPIEMPDDLTTRWQHDAACRGEDYSYFYAPNYFEKRSQKNAREAVAKALCVRCPVREVCLEYALDVRETHGIWGGYNEMERRAILRERARRAG